MNFATSSLQSARPSEMPGYSEAPELVDISAPPAPPSFTTRIVKNLFTNYLTTFLGLALGFVLIPFLIRHLGKDAYGLIVLAESTIAFFEMASVSVRMSLSRFATIALAQNKRREFVDYLSTVRVLLILSAIFVFCVGAGASFFFDKIFQVPITLLGQSKILFLCISVAFAAAIPNMVYWAVLYSQHRYDLINLSSSYGIFFRALSLFGLFSILPERWATLTVYGVIYMATVTIQNLAVYFWVKKIMPKLKIRVRSFNTAKAQEVLSYGGYVGISQVSGLLYQNATAILINLFWGPAFNAIYAISLKFPSILTRVFEEATWSLTSTFQEWVALGEKNKVRKLFFFYTKFVTIVTAPLCFALIFIAKPLIAFWVGPEFAVAAKLMPIHLGLLFLQLPLGISGCLIQAHGRIKWPSLGSLLAASASLALGVFLARGLGLGVFGFAVAIAVVAGSYILGFSSWYACNISDIPVLDYWRKALLMPWLWALTASVCARSLIEPWIMIAHYATGMLIFCASTAAYALIAYGIVLDFEEKQHVQKMLKQLRKRLREGFSRPSMEVL